MGTIQIDGSTPKITVGNATAEDATILFDGNAQDFYIALDDSADDLVIGLGSTVGTTPAISINSDRDVTISDGAIDFDIASHDTSNGLKLGGTLVTATAAELNIMDGVTSTAAELNIMDGVTSTAAELNIMDGVTSTAAEINLIDGGTARGTTAIADGDGVLINDGGTMRQTTVETLSTYIGGGIANVDQWRTTDHTEYSGAGRHFVTANWEQNDTTGFEVLGSSMTESSGVFTFPSTGKWLVRFIPGCTNREGGTNRALVYIFIEINGTRDNSSYTQIANAFTSNDDAGAEWYMSGTAEFLWDVTNTSNDKVKFGFYVANGMTTKGDSGLNRTYATFMRIGDT